MESILDTLQKFVKIKSVSSDLINTTIAIDFVQDWFKGIPGLHCRREISDGVSSVLISTKEALDFDVLMLGHADVVPAHESDFEPKIDGDKFYARGSADMKGMVSVAMHVLAMLPSNVKLDKSIGLLVVSDEEIGGHNGAEYWVNKLGVRAKILLDMDAGSSIDIMVEKSKAPVFVKFTSTGVSAHGSLPWLGVDAIEELMLTLNNLRREFPYYSQLNSINDEWIPTMHIGKFNGGEAVNSVSETASAEVDFRLTDVMKPSELKELIDVSCRPKVKYEIVSSANIVKTDVSNPVIQKYIKLVESKINRTIKFISMGGSTDAKHFALSNTVIIPHQATGDNIHNDGEWVCISDLNLMFEIYTKFITEI
ncbi:MAG: M20 family metallopeptidase [Rickettsiales bacterium]|jgi:succinyl-diaminopimelate desuccinylase|nr:M20 family metallopeptidase [Rickettsiales bacterium]